MIKTVDALFDGVVFHPSEPIALEPNTHVRITVETASVAVEQQQSFLDTALSLKLEGPQDWSRNLHKYLYGEGGRGEA